MTKAYEEFQDNLGNLKQFYSEFIKHFGFQKQLLRVIETSTTFIDYLMTSYHLILKPCEKDNFFKVIKKLGYSSEDIPRKEEVIKKLPYIESMTFEEIYKKTVENRSSDFFTKKSTEKKRPKEYSDIIDFMTEEFKFARLYIEVSKEKLIKNFLGMCIIHAWTIFETYLKDIISIVKSLNHKRFQSDVKLFTHQMPKIKSPKIIWADEPYFFGRWYNLKTLFEKVWTISFFPSKKFQKKYGIESKIQGQITFQERLQIINICRNALVHCNGVIRQKDVDRARFPKKLPQKVHLNKEYIQYIFIMINTLVQHIDSQIDLKFFSQRVN